MNGLYTSRRPGFWLGFKVVAAACAVTMVAGMVEAVPAAAASHRPANPASLNAEPVFAVHELGAPAAGRPKVATFTPAAVTWPAATTAEVDLSAAAKGAATVSGEPHVVRAESTPVSVGAAAASGNGMAAAAVPGRVGVQVFDHAAAVAAGADAMLLRLARADGLSAAGTATVSVDYSGFADAYGADWSSRLRLVTLPACAVSTPAEPSCRVATALIARNDTIARTVSASVGLPAVESATTSAGTAKAVPGGGIVVALTAGASGAAGDYSATGLSASSAWSAGSNTGEFTWSYPMRTPPSLGGPAPALNLAYNSASVDGRTAASNNQPSWIGEGFEFGPGGFIERRYVPCASDAAGSNNPALTGDLCWQTRSGTVAMNLTMSLGGSGSELIPDAADPNRWHPRNEDGSLIQRRTGAPNGDDDGEFFVVTTTDGTQYWFGSQADTSSAWTVPVYGNHSGEPCHQAGFAASSCTQAYRWNLDYVVDPHGNTMRYTYTTETNQYATAGNPNTLKAYIRGGYLTSITYGTRTDTPASDAAPARVLFDVQDRCASGCWSGPEPVTANWPDTPWDQRCTSTPCNDIAPAFYTAKRLSQVTTQVWDAPTSRYRDVERWTLTHSYPPPGDGTRAGLFLERIAHVGLVGPPGTNTTVPDVTFTAEAMHNRVNPMDGRPTMNWHRLKTITTETGGIIAVNYTPQDCVPGLRMPDPSALQNNTMRCFPVRWDDGSGSTLEFFHKYLVASVSAADTTALAPTEQTFYEYVGDPAWHYTDDDGLVPDAAKTWSVWRGYATVRTTSGSPDDPTTVRTQTERTYFRGMQGDHLPSGSRTVTLPAIDLNGDGDTNDPADAPAVVDEDAFAGHLRQSLTRLGVGGAEVSSSVAQPWQSAPTATRTIGGVTTAARFVGTAATYAREAIDTDSGRRAAGWRITSTTTTFDSLGLATRTEDRGDDAVAGDETCRLVDYARDPAVLADPSPDASRWKMAYPSRVRDFAVDCATATATGAQLSEDDVVADTVTIYDHQTPGAAPTVGDTTETRVMKAWDQATQAPTYLTASSGSYDPYGRISEAWDVRGNRSTTSYTPATGGPVTSTSTKNHLGWTTTATLEPAWGEPLTSTDANGRKLDRAYDGLGRLTGVWQPGRSKANQTPTTSYTYAVRTQPDASYVITSALNPTGGYTTTYQLYDALLRPRQTQAPDAVGAGRIITDTFYDSAGRPYLQTSPYRGDGAPGTSIVEFDGDKPLQIKTLFDGVGRPVAAITLSNGNELWRTVTAYTGDRVDNTPPEGGTATSEVRDIHGTTTALRQYHGPDPTGPYDTTTYTYDRKQQLRVVTDPATNSWRYNYDLLGRQTGTDDPDRGTTTVTYNDYGDLTTSTDARGEVLAYTYDSLGRKTSLRDDSDTGALRAEWTYDGLPNSRGLLTKSTRWVGANAYITETTGLSATYQPSSIKYTIPAAETGVAGSYTYNFTYTPDDSPAAIFVPDVDGPGGLAQEQLTYGYNELGAPITLSTSVLNTKYVTNTTYTSYGEPDTITLQNNGGPSAYIQYGYKYGTRRLGQIRTTRDTAPTTVSDVQYDYDKYGNVKSITDQAPVSPDNQCFTHDYLRRLTQAWTPTDGNCDQTPSTANLGGPAPYWTTWTIDQVGNRKTQTEHATSTGERSTNYTYPDAATAQPHTLTAATTTDATGTKRGDYGYDATGNTTSRPPTTGASNQTLTWDAEGHLESVTDNGATTSFLYDADGNRLLRRDATGTTLYLPGQELRYTSATAKKATTRYYTHAGTVVATRTSAGLTWLSADVHGTTTATIAATGGQDIAIRRTTPYGDVRGSTGTWPSTMDKGFVGGTEDPTGLTHLGAREYDPDTGRFISVDPIIDVDDPQQMHGYAYASNSPVTMSDPDGLRVYEENDNRSACDAACQAAATASTELNEAKKAKAEAEKVTKKSVKDIIIEAGAAFLLDLLGITDLINCVTKGQIGACINTVLNALPVGKILKLGKSIWRAADRIMTGYRAWRKAVSAVQAVVKRADDAIRLAQRRLDDALDSMSDGALAMAGKDRPHAGGNTGPWNRGRPNGPKGGSGRDSAELGRSGGPNKHGNEAKDTFNKAGAAQKTADSLEKGATRPSPTSRTTTETPTGDGQHTTVPVIQAPSPNPAVMTGPQAPGMGGSAAVATCILCVLLREAYRRGAL